MRIVSLVPSWTEYVVDLGCAEELVGRTKFCVRAGEEAERIQVIGGTKRIHLDQVEQLKPDLVIASREENTREDVEACRAFTEVLVTDVRTIPDAFEALETIGVALQRAAAGVTWRSNIEQAWGEPRTGHAEALYAIWQKPLMVAGYDTYIHAVMNWWGIGNAAPASAEGRYPELHAGHLDELAGIPILLASEPYPFASKHCAHFASAGLRPMLVDGEAFSWYGSRMLHTVDYLKAMHKALDQLPR
jgi:ABC-type Fe3+-hydroxamate transport system substrate-binding protein